MAKPPNDRGSAWRQATAVILGLIGADVWSSPVWAGTDVTQMALLPAGPYTPFFVREDPKLKTNQTLKRSVPIKAFWLDLYPVTNGQYLDFVKKHPEWQKSKAKPIFVDSHYLAGWDGDLTWGGGARATQPVTNVSWFAANAYCRALGKSLPTTDQWEYAVADNGRAKEAINEKVLSWYGTPNTSALPSIEQSDKNGFGIYGLVGLVWEWTLDFNSVMTGGELRQSGKDKNLFCGGSSLNAADPTDYAAFMRFSMRSSLKATYTTPNLGFRCAKDKS